MRVFRILLFAVEGFSIREFCAIMSGTDKIGKNSVETGKAWNEKRRLFRLLSIITF